VKLTDAPIRLQPLPGFTRRSQQSFLAALITRRHQEIEDLLFYQDCKAAKDEGFLSDPETQSFVATLP